MPVGDTSHPIGVVDDDFTTTWLLGSFIFDINFGHERGFHALALNKQINNQTYNINIHGNTTYTHVQQCVLQLCRILFIKDKMLTTKMVS